MKRKRIAPLMFAILFLSGLTLALGDPVPEGNVPGSSADDNDIVNVYYWTGNGGVAVEGSSQGWLQMSGSGTSSWTFSLSGVIGTIEQAWLYIGAFDGLLADAPWTFDLVRGGATTNLATSISAPYDYDSAYDVYRFDVTTFLNDPGTVVNGLYSVDVEHFYRSGFDYEGIYGAAIVVVYSDSSLPPLHVWINDGCEWIYDATTSTTFPDKGQWPTGTSASLHTIVGGGELTHAFRVVDKDEVLFDANLLATDPFDSSNGQSFDVDSFNVLPYMGAGAHSATFNDVGDPAVDYSLRSDGFFVYLAVLSYNPGGMNVIPEVPYGTITTMSLMVLAFALYVKRPF